MSREDERVTDEAIARLGKKVQRINFRVTDETGNKNVLSIIQGSATYGIAGRSVEVAYYTIDGEKFPDVVSYVDFVELENILRDIRLGATPDKIEQKYVKDLED